MSAETNGSAIVGINSWLSKQNQRRCFSRDTQIGSPNRIGGASSPNNMYIAFYGHIRDPRVTSRSCQTLRDPRSLHKILFKNNPAPSSLLILQPPCLQHPQHPPHLSMPTFNASFEDELKTSQSISIYMHIVDNGIALSQDFCRRSDPHLQRKKFF